jgi:transposase
MGKDDKERRNYPEKFKTKAVALTRKHEKPLRQIAADLGVTENTLRRWMRQTQDAVKGGSPAFPGHGRPWDNELTRLKKEVKALRTANEILKKSGAHLRTKTSPVMVYQFMSENHSQYTIRAMAALLGVSCSTYYKWAKYGRHRKDRGKRTPG